MREIKVRGLDNNGIWDYLYMRKLKFIGGENVIFYSWHVKPETIGQYTGLNDKNGKEIYEGDIVKIYIDRLSDKDKSLNERFATVTWDDFSFGFMLSFFIKFGDPMLNRVRMNVPERIEIVGNIYENPELLEKTYSTREAIKVEEEKLKEDEAFISAIKDKYKI